MPIGDLFSVQQGKALSPSAREGRSRRPFLRTANVRWGHLDLTTIDEMHFEEAEAQRLALVPGDLLVCEGGEIGRAAVWGGEVPGCLYQNHVHRLRSSTGEIAPEFIMFWLQAGFLRLGLYAGVGNKTTIPNLSAARLKQLFVPVPPRVEQERIARVLSRIHARVSVEERRVALLRALKAATMAKLFREGLHSERLEDTEIGEMPTSWQVQRLGDPAFCTMTAGGTPSRADPECFGGPIKWVKSGELKDDILTETEESLSEKGLRKSSAKVLPARTLLVAMYGATAGMTTILGISATTNQAVCAALPVNSSFDSEFLRHYLVKERPRLLAARHGGAQPNLSQQILKAVHVPRPPIKEQREIGSKLVVINERIRMATHRRQALSRLFDSTLYALMTGSLRLPVPPHA